MSATIPNGMLLSDLLKATGYDCPSTLQGKTFKQATAGAGIDLEANHASTVDVSTYTQAIEIEPSDTYEAMEKVTLTLTGIVKGLIAFGSAEGAVYLTAIPSADGAVKAYVPSATGISKVDATYAEATGVTISEIAYARYADGDITF
jgi:hypothetical protein